jgi:hypothetical protein
MVILMQTGDRSMLATINAVQTSIGGVALLVAST